MNIFSHIKEQISILDVIGAYVTLKKAGLYYKGCCPFHHEKTASFTVSPHKEIFYCFGCHVGGDVISFISRIEQGNQLEAAKFLVDRYQIQVPESAFSSESKSPDKRKRYFLVNELVAQWCHELLLKSPAVLRYVHDRGIDRACINTFTLGYFPEGPSAIKSLLHYLSEHQILADDLFDAHILHKGKASVYSPFEQRIIFPITDHVGNHCGFGGRIYKNQDTRAKYYNSQENEFFNKGSLLYGLHLAKESMQKKNAVFLVEGYTDCIAMVQHGYKNTVASLGTACTIEHLKLLSRFIEQVYVLYDGDAAGKQAVLRLTELCWQANLEMKIVELPKGEDPASYLKKEINIDPLIKEAKDIFTFFVESLGVDFKQQSLNQKLQTTRKIIALIGNIKDSIKQDILLQEAAEVLTIPYQTLKDNLYENRSSTIQTEQKRQFQIENISDKIVDEELKLEKKILSAILNNVSLFRAENRQCIYHLLPATYVSILTKLEEVLQKSSNYTLSDLFEQLNEQEKLITNQAVFSSEDSAEKDSFEHLIRQLQKKNWKAIVNSIKSKLEVAKNQGDTEKLTELIQEFAALKQMMLEKE